MQQAQQISGDQIQAARVLLKMTRKQLAKATGLAPNTIRNLEQGGISPRDATNSILIQVIENLGIELIEGDGVRRRTNDVRFLGGKNSYDDLLDIIQRTIEQKGGQIAFKCRSLSLLAETLGMSVDNLKPLEMITRIAPVECLLAEAPKLLTVLPEDFECRVTFKENISAQTYFILADKYIHPVVSCGRAPRYMVYNLPDAARLEREHFDLLWHDALEVSSR